MKARRQVQNARLTLDAAKATAKAARPERADAARVEVEHAEDAFVGKTLCFLCVLTGQLLSRKRRL
jgi:Bin/amphiphysin/Rvs domain for vesicular trafficking